MPEVLINDKSSQLLLATLLKLNDLQFDSSKQYFRQNDKDEAFIAFISPQVAFCPLSFILKTE